ncbi:MAG: GGDEF domain-containing protein [Planctomycetaceae bacterium]|nr:GGDEF domain-containing protein [Planctomycetaceae bacterium]
MQLASNNPFEKVFIVFSDLQEPKRRNLKAFCQSCADTEIIVLARMHEEPEVREALRQAGNKRADYLICPIDADLLTFDRRRMKPAEFAHENEKDRRIRELEILVLQDDLTGLKNRRYLRHFLPAILQEAVRCSFQVTLLLFDIDDFKHYNDTYGHSVGDRVLRQTASLMRRCCRTQDVVARLGGDEFAVVFWDRSVERDMAEQTAEDRRTARDHPKEAFFMAERFRKEMSAASFDMLGIKGKGSLTISGGLATFPNDASSAEVLFERADQAMLEAKRSGKNRVYLVGEPVNPANGLQKPQHP